jgi:hypothetical protein
LANQHSCAAIRMDIPPHAVSEIVILGPPSLQNVMMSHVMRHRFGMDCRILAAEAADIAGHIGDLRGSLLLIDCGAQAVEQSLQALPATNAPKGCVLALYNVRKGSAPAQWAADRGICDVFPRSECVDRIMDGVRRCLG